MKSILFFSLCFVLYVCVIVALILKARDIAKNTKKYDVIPGHERYRNSVWYESGNIRHGKHYRASLILGIGSLFAFVFLYYQLGVLIQKHYFLPVDVVYLQSSQLYIGAIACMFFVIIFEGWISFHSKASICIANSLYMLNDPRRSDSWAKLTLYMLIVCILCLPVMAISINAYSYADDEKIVTHKFLSIEEEIIPYDTIVSGQTSFSSNKAQSEFDFDYHIYLQDGTRMNLMEFGNRGVVHLDAIFQEWNIPIQYGQMNSVTYQLIKQTCNDSTVQMVDECYVVVS
ncbi:MAG: hypothetical protein IIW56_08415 [Oscillospiraceae bacterium]|nr:hypothetical protein [Oscillospiraceae bacterium]